MALFKAQAHMRELKQRLSLLLPSSVSYTDSLDANGMPQLQVTSAVPENEFIKIQTEADNAQHVDGLGLPQRVYSPHECIILREAAASANAADASIREIITSACSKLGMKLTIREGTGVAAAASYSAADALATTTVAVLPSDEINKLTQSQ
jgi:hypothetical protein